MVPISYTVRSLVVRRATTLAAAGGVAVVAFVIAAMLMLTTGVERTLARSGRDDVAVVLRRGAEAELASGIEQASASTILADPRVARREDGQPDGIREVVVLIVLDKAGGDGVSNVQVRGTEDSVFAFRREARIVAGRKARPGTDECVIGRAVRGRFAGLDVGGAVELRKGRTLQVVGVFEAAGTAFESEIWADADVVRAIFGREGISQSVRARLARADALDAFAQALESDRQLRVRVLRESTFYAQQSEDTALFIRILGSVVVAFFAAGAMLGAMNTMFAAVINRKREIGTLRALGFRRGAILRSFLLESVALALIGGVVGAALSLTMGAVRFSLVNPASWSELVFRLEPTPRTVAIALLAAVGMGLLGGILPAVRAARMPLVRALKK